MGLSQPRSGLPALLDLGDLAIVRDDLRPQWPALPQPVCLAHSTKPSTDCTNSAGTEQRGFPEPPLWRAEMTYNMAPELQCRPRPLWRSAQQCGSTPGPSIQPQAKGEVFPPSVSQVGIARLQRGSSSRPSECWAVKPAVTALQREDATDSRTVFNAVIPV